MGAATGVAFDLVLNALTQKQNDVNALAFSAAVGCLAGLASPLVGKLAGWLAVKLGPPLAKLFGPAITRLGETAAGKLASGLIERAIGRIGSISRAFANVVGAAFRKLDAKLTAFLAEKGWFKGLVAAAKRAERPTLFRGTSEGFPGNPHTLRAGVTPASTDPQVAAAFATHAEQFGQGVVHIASGEDLAGVEAKFGLGYLRYESEAYVYTTPSDFAARAGRTITAQEARAALGEMGIHVPSQIRTAGEITQFLQPQPPMTADQIAEFLARVQG